MPMRKPTTKKAKAKAMKTTMDEFKGGSLRSGSKDGPKVTNPKQAIAIGLKESGQDKKKTAMSRPRDKKDSAPPSKGNAKPAPKKTSMSRPRPKKDKLDDVTF